MKRYWYKFRVKYGKALDTGKNKKVSEEYLVDAESFTETEKRATKAATELIGTRDFDITAISREPITEILKEDEKEGNRQSSESHQARLNDRVAKEDGEANHWYKTVVSLVTEDEETGVKKFSPQTIYVNAPSTKEADHMLRQHMSSSVTEWKIKSIAETKVLGVLGYKQ